MKQYKHNSIVRSMSKIIISQIHELCTTITLHFSQTLPDESTRCLNKWMNIDNITEKDTKNIIKYIDTIYSKALVYIILQDDTYFDDEKNSYSFLPGISFTMFFSKDVGSTIKNKIWYHLNLLYFHVIYHKLQTKELLITNYSETLHQLIMNDIVKINDKNDALYVQKSNESLQDILFNEIKKSNLLFSNIQYMVTLINKSLNTEFHLTENTTCKNIEDFIQTLKKFNAIEFKNLIKEISQDPVLCKIDTEIIINEITNIARVCRLTYDSAYLIDNKDRLQDITQLLHKIKINDIFKDDNIDLMKYFKTNILSLLPLHFQGIINSMLNKENVAVGENENENMKSSYTNLKEKLKARRDERKKKSIH